MLLTLLIKIKTIFWLKIFNDVITWLGFLTLYIILSKQFYKVLNSTHLKILLPSNVVSRILAHYIDATTLRFHVKPLTSQHYTFTKDLIAYRKKAQYNIPTKAAPHTILNTISRNILKTASYTIFEVNTSYYTEYHFVL